MIATTVDRVPANTCFELNEAIRNRTERRIAECASLGHLAIDRRLHELDEEWDIERLLECNASVVTLVGLTLGATVDKRWFLLSGLVAGFLLQHSVQGWCPPLPIFRRLGIRTASEIDYERYALKAIRGDFQGVAGKEKRTASGAHAALEAVRV
jgi:hypothetical protein